jgi:hypothetical protein
MYSPKSRVVRIYRSYAGGPKSGRDIFEVCQTTPSHSNNMNISTNAVAAVVTVALTLAIFTAGAAAIYCYFRRVPEQTSNEDIPLPVLSSVSKTPQACTSGTTVTTAPRSFCFFIYRTLMRHGEGRVVHGT